MITVIHVNMHWFQCQSWWVSVSNVVKLPAVHSLGFPLPGPGTHSSVNRREVMDLIVQLKKLIHWHHALLSPFNSDDFVQRWLWYVCLRADLVSVSSPGLFRYEKTAAVSCKATVGPVGVVETKRATTVAVTWILDGDGVGHHGDYTAAARIPLSLGGGKKEERHISSKTNKNWGCNVWLLKHCTLNNNVSGTTDRPNNFRSQWSNMLHIPRLHAVILILTQPLTSTSNRCTRKYWRQFWGSLVDIT